MGHISEIQSRQYPVSWEHLNFVLYKSTPVKSTIFKFIDPIYTFFNLGKQLIVKSNILQYQAVNKNS